MPKKPEKKPDYASLYTLRSDGRYQGYYYDDNGKRHIVCKADPEALHKAIAAKKEKPPLTFRQIAEAWHDAAWDAIKGGTKESYEAPYNRAVDRFGDRIAKEISAYDLQNHLQELKAQNYAASTIKTQRIIYRQVYQFAILDKTFCNEIHDNPAQNIKVPAGSKKAVKREAPEDAVVKAIRQNASTAYFGLYAMLLICTGFRRGEALGLQWADVDFKGGWISCSKQVTHRGGTAQVTETKTENGVRKVPLLGPLKQVLVKPSGAAPEDFLFYGNDPKKPISYATFERRWMHYCKDMGFVTDEPETKVSKQNKTYTVHHYKTTLTPHVLRHGYATILFEADVDVYTAKKYLGHADIRTTMAIYTHLREQKNQESLDKLKAYADTAL